MNNKKPTHAPFLPTTAKEVENLGWDYIDVILFSGDAYIDHPAFGAAVIGRTLEAAGYRVAIVPQPNWRDDLRDFKKLGKPRLFFGVSAGAMDSMVNKYTPTKRLRSEDAYTPDGRADMRPDYPTIIYSQILKSIYPETPLFIGGIEASLRRLTHYDYWESRLRPSILIDSKADGLIYGMGEKTVVELAKKISKGDNWNNVKQLAYISSELPEGDFIKLNSFEDCVKNKKKYGENFVNFETQSNKIAPQTLVEQTGNQYIIVNSGYPFFTTQEIDASFDLPYSRLPHPKYKDKKISAYEMIKHSINIHRGCFGGCSFCAISAHQGKFISSRSEKSILQEIKELTKSNNFKGNLSDVGGPSANMWGMRGKNVGICSKCIRPSCIFPKKCINLQNDHSLLLRLYDKIENVAGIKKFYIGSGIRYDFFDNDKYLDRVITKHTSGRLKIAPEHTQDNVLELMRKPSFGLFEEVAAKFTDICKRDGLNYQLVPYFISSHPGCKMDDMVALKRRVDKLDVYVEPVQDFTPTPMTLSTAMYYLCENPYSGQAVYVAREKAEKDNQKGCFFETNAGKPAQRSSLKNDRNIDNKNKNQLKYNNHGSKRIRTEGAVEPVRTNLRDTSPKRTRRGDY